MENLSFVFSLLLIISVTTTTFGSVIKAKNPNGKEYEALLKQPRDAEAKLQKSVSNQDKEDHKSAVQGDEALKEVLSDTENPVKADESTHGRNVHAGLVKFAGGKIKAAGARAASLEIGVHAGQVAGVLEDQSDDALASG